ncbi:MAG: hypothetical protein C4539_08450 [Ignavibacteriales bacterium]|nr:MAG: hypothetical protein C4539_08450 [Ignavibacteriales bacterium]
MSLFRSTIWYTIGNLFSRSLSFILLPFYSNLIPVDEYGTYSLIMACYVIFSALYQGGLYSAFTKYYFETEEEEERKRLFSTLFFFITSVSLIISVSLNLFNKELSVLIFSNDDGSVLIRYIIWILFVDTLFYTILHLIKTQEKSQKVVYYTSISSVFNLVFNLFFVYYQHNGVLGIMQAQLLSGIFSVFIIIPVLKNYLKLKMEKEALVKLLIFSLPLLISGLLSTFVDIIDRFLLDKFLDKTAVGLYSFSYRIAMVMNLFVISFRTAWTPYSLRLYKKSSDLSYSLGLSFSKLLATSILIFLITNCFIDDLFRFKISDISIFNIAYVGGIPIIPVIMIGYLFSGLSSFYSVYPYVANKSYHFLVSDLIAFIVNIVLNIILIPQMNLMGAALATMISFIAGCIYLFIISRSIEIYYQRTEIIVFIIFGTLAFIITNYFKLLFIDIALLISFSYLVFSLTGMKNVIMKS